MVCSPIVTGTNKILQSQVLNLNDLQKDRLEYEAMIRNPETAYLVSNEEFDKNWMPSVGHLPIWSRCQECTSKRNVRTEKIIRDWFRELLEVLFQAAALVIDSIRTFFLIVLSILGTYHLPYPSGMAFSILLHSGFPDTYLSICGCL